MIGNLWRLHCGAAGKRPPARVELPEATKLRLVSPTVKRARGAIQKRDQALVLEPLKLHERTVLSLLGLVAACTVPASSVHGQIVPGFEIAGELVSNTPPAWLINVSP